MYINLVCPAVEHVPTSHGVLFNPLRIPQLIFREINHNPCVLIKRGFFLKSSWEWRSMSIPAIEARDSFLVSRRLLPRTKKYDTVLSPLPYPYQ